jgi:hypothetical protein
VATTGERVPGNPTGAPSTPNRAHVIGAPFSIAFGVNSRGFVVGNDSAGGFGYIQEGGQEQFYRLDDLTDGLPSGGKIASGHHINDDGVIIVSVDISTSDPMNPEHRSGLLVPISSN